ncbi:isoleucine--tRNA ligase [Spirulina major CS-329]|uniref:isoleucine--tRNA ligase n=1 Tax=Spirulina TaxID=1154 RepID=UPI00232E003A|nr:MULTISPECIES: isoleucine--tRNA ligase [Spirulina]MDB9494492.1 isoleucine--tRNA ligase [Spirulina subsalsa CS-330]MDB9502783.1 isoleucine--tRNA ligase [Spirulina major CS-329]
MTEPKSYKDTINLPKTDFNMRANAVKREPELQQFWHDERIYETLAAENPRDRFILHDGPPYANGALHMGHALNKILKDIINKYKLLQGYKVRYVPGWDCHGLPIELKVIQTIDREERKTLTPLALRYKARDFAIATMEDQRTGFKRFGVWGDWENPYLTLKPEYEAAQIGVFGKMALNGYIYRGLKAVHWSPSSKTALAEAELEYPEGHTSRSIYAAFTITHLAPTAEALGEFLPDLGVAIWTTTPWTIPGNLAVAVNSALTYAVVEVEQPLSGHRYWLVAADLVETLAAKFATPLTVKTTIAGAALEHCTYRHPLYDRTSPIVIGGDYITTESGTGLVHTAPGHGQEDFITGQKYGLPILSPVDADGVLTAEAGPFEGLNVLKDANGAIIAALTAAQSLILAEDYVHKYPYDWRTKKPTIFRATEQWFASVEGFRDEALKAISSVQWIPAQGQNRITPMVSDRADWCISRQRSWGVPIPVFYDEATNEPLLTEETIAHVQGIIAERGSDAWWELSVAELLPPSYRDNGKTYRKGTDTMDVWFDSGSSWAAVADRREELTYPVDLYLEGSDQHRGWFQSSLLTSVATNGIAPYKTVLTHGFALDEKGRKMSKSLGNVVDPMLIINGGKNQQQEPPYGADVLRLWVSSVDYSSDVPIGKTILKQLSDVYRKIRNTARFLLGNLHDFDPKTDAVAYEDLPELDRYMLHCIDRVFNDVTEAFESYQFFKFFQTVQNFCVVDLSNFYLDIAKDRLYISALNSPRRRSCQTVLAIALENLAKAIAPVLSHMAEDIWQSLPYPSPAKSVFAAGWVTTDSAWQQPDLATKWEQLRALRDEVNKVMEQARSAKAIGASLDAKVLLYVSDATLRHTLAAMNPSDALGDIRVDALRYLFLASQVELTDSADVIAALDYHSTTEAVTVGITTAAGEKCDRCWNYSPTVGNAADDPTICDRCVNALSGQF